jgi:hypothetical protein
MANVLFGTQHTDLCYGYNAFWADCLPVLQLADKGPVVDEQRWGDGFEIETVINARIAMAGLHVTEVASYEHERIHGESNLNTWRDGLRVLRALVLERFRPPVVAPSPVEQLRGRVASAVAHQSSVGMAVSDRSASVAA